MKFITLFFAFFIAIAAAETSPDSKIPGYRKWKHKHHTTLETKASKTTEGTIVIGKGTLTAPALKDPRCKKDADCAPGTCLNGICLAPVDGDSSSPKETGMFSLDDLWRRDELGSGRKCKTNNDCAKDKQRPWCGMDDRCVKTRPPGTECHMDSNCKKGEACKKARCISLSRFASRALSALVARDDDEVVNQPGDGYEEDDNEGTEEEEEGVEKSKRRDHLTHADLPGDANDWTSKKDVRIHYE